MPPKKLLSLEISERYTEGSVSAPEDPLGELSESEINFRRFCFEQNHVVEIALGDMQERAVLFPDILLAFRALMDLPENLKRQGKAEVVFPENMFRLEFQTRAAKVDCRLQEFGYRTESDACTLSLSDVLKAVQSFTNDVLARAIQADYLTPEQARHLFA